MFYGLDVHKAFIQVCKLGQDGEWDSPSNASRQRRRRALGWLSKTARHGSSREYVIEVVVFGSPMVWLALG